MRFSTVPPTERLKAGVYVFVDQIGHNPMSKSQMIEEITSEGITVECGFFDMHLARIKFDKQGVWYDLTAFEYDVGVAEGEVSHHKSHLYMMGYI